jgi:Flp pilus assembly protein TadB
VRDLDPDTRLTLGVLLVIAILLTLFEGLGGLVFALLATVVTLWLDRRARRRRRRRA